ncbi:MAG TPA: type IV conjugative transfer system lipoprotein TraV [Thermodesulfobacteriota bacterium]|nr:type IV conjugative transfer system lipoprotein TraV [Thermodesulfobacteriota bacterium]
MKTKLAFFITLALSILIFQACGGPKYGCSYGEGVSCESVSTVYKDSLSGELEKKKEEERNLRELEKEKRPRKLGTGEISYVKTKGKNWSSSQASSSSASTAISFNPGLKSDEPNVVPLRTPPDVLRVWVAPWEDKNGALHGGNYIYLVVNSGRWIFGNKEVEESGNIIPLESVTDGNTAE